MGRNFTADLRRVRPGRYAMGFIGELDGSSAAEALLRLENLRDATVILDFSRTNNIELFASRVLARGLRELRNRRLHFEVEALPEDMGETLCLGGVLEAVGAMGEQRSQDLARLFPLGGLVGQTRQSRRDPTSGNENNKARPRVLPGRAMG